MVRDLADLDEAKKRGRDRRQSGLGESVQKTIEQVYQTPEPLLKCVREIIGGQDY